MASEQLAADYVNGELKLVEEQPLLGSDNEATVNGDLSDIPANLPEDALKEPLIEIFDYDLIIVGAGISGINMAYRAKSMLKGKSYVVLEQRQQMGGTWDLVSSRKMCCIYQNIEQS
jgi:hypothetical protein